MEITKAKMNSRSLNCLKSEGIENFDDLLKYSPTDILDLPNAGLFTVRDVIYSLTLAYLGHKWFRVLAHEILERAKDTY